MTKNSKLLVKVGLMALLVLPLVAFGQELDLGTEFGADTGLGERDLQDIIVSIINIALSFLGIIAVVVILIGGFTWMTAGGNEDRVDTAKKMIFAGIIGLAIVLSAYAIAQFAISSLVDATGGAVA
jgi:hypothetical protein